MNGDWIEIMNGNVIAIMNGNVIAIGIVVSLKLSYSLAYMIFIAVISYSQYM